MRKNKMMRLASALLVAVLLTTCAISGTFAKYVTSANSTDSARVAKWGVVIDANGTLFAKAYDGTVETTGASNVVAPGTAGELAKMTLSGTPEVDVKVTYVGTVELTGWADSNGDYYCPLEVTVGATTLKGNDYASMDLFEAAIKQLIDNTTISYEANTNLSTKAGDSLAVSWVWDYEGNDDVKDTFLGDQAAADNAATILVNIVTTVTQID